MGIIVSENPSFISSIEDIIEDAKAGKVFVLIDDEQRENEGDLVVLAEKVTTDAINLMVTHGSGIVCLSITEDLMYKLGLELIPRRNINNNSASFATSIDARYGITTGVSVHDRVRTILTAVSKNVTMDDLVTPGHIFPIVSKKGGVLERLGHTEASVDIARIAGLTPAAVVCELMNPDGTMSRLSDIIEFSQRYDIKVTTIAKLVEYINTH
ncbi:3,4-dihydroxy-2-butanone 4-phosphate synthase [Ehrlichia ruminantium]|uniref:3,4-dihydroxy-2-butanone-4-phosphate synthase n=1 Tax=Ehrlichia ruminantium TaxID=779 RepID=UPI00004C76C9|nr:3,4-dihydroxy-2-butanone-4-phosphate synthase [Ehrlichia ruminantium]QLK52005.1 3,4-dihydroxy-2-butanone-4-phosphate synthase [Ehrlichia ruminantium]QLK53838.1 3,4-dihydroxy-2-butanone-4-phosphate synthase [Ehrlichia ruminantium]QLK56590.1 3,4-dihydroxy-2-butanone-4-phosphate synthase [Ehrlichia ruminantium]QLK57500.1 3,4-dihydroxy-2-butanone-4-phosphate synthase [Ehrlichia ruminantium]QLK58418.1 3,4-dihydroxy-2-butanone-4-phosphate synthase [Ehrlichia ruminantium]